MIDTKDLKLINEREFVLHEFEVKGTFESLYEAQGWLHKNGYSCASLCGNYPVGLLKGDIGIAKWKNLTQQEKIELDGVMLSGDFREGKVTIKIYTDENSTTK